MRRSLRTLGRAQSNRRCICVNNRVLKARLRFALAYLKTLDGTEA